METVHNQLLQADGGESGNHTDQNKQGQMGESTA